MNDEDTKQAAQYVGLTARRNRPFTDGAGFTRHCWECAHAKGWADDMAACDVTGRFVYKFDSPNNQCSHLPARCRYETGERAAGQLRHDFGAVGEYVFTDPGLVFTFVMEGEKVSLTAREVFQIIKALKGLKHE